MFLNMLEILIYVSAYIGFFGLTYYVLNLISHGKDNYPEFERITTKKIPFVSVIIPAFNEERGIAGTLESALKLDYPKDKLEIIVVDDGSKDDTYKIASKFKSKRVKVYRFEKNQGKGAAMNYAIKKSRGEFIVTMDADNLIVEKGSLKHMISNFKNPKIMCVAPVIVIYKPKGILQRIQQIEYMLGVFLRKAFASMNAIHITPGAFSAYRKSFFDKYGGFDPKNITEDMEMAMRIQYNHYRIENDTRAVVYTIAPNKFISLYKQRRRWYVGLLTNFLNYKKMFSKKYGSLGLIVMPVAIATVFLSVILTFYMFINALIRLRKELVLLDSVNFDILNTIEFNKFVLERYVFFIFSNPIWIFSLIFIGVLLGYMVYAKTKVKKYTNIKFSLIFFIIFYSFLFALWWSVSFIYTLFNRKVAWR